MHAKRIRDSLKHTVVRGDSVPKVRNKVSGAHIVGQVTEVDLKGAGMMEKHGQFEAAIRKAIEFRKVLAPSEGALNPARHIKRGREHLQQHHHQSRYKTTLNFEYLTEDTEVFTRHESPVFAARPEVDKLISEEAKKIEQNLKT